MDDRQTVAIMAAIMTQAEIQKTGAIGDEQITRYVDLALKLLRTVGVQRSSGRPSSAEG